MKDTITICRACGYPIIEGELVLEPDFTFETGLHAAGCCPEVDGLVLSDEDELRALDLAVLAERAN